MCAHVCTCEYACVYIYVFGVYVNNERIQEKYKLVADDEVKIGSAIFKVLKSGR